MTIRVQCCAGQNADERPMSFELDGRVYFVEETIHQWQEPSAAFFKVRADDGNIYTLSRDSIALDGEWRLESVKQIGV